MLCIIYDSLRLPINHFKASLLSCFCIDCFKQLPKIWKGIVWSIFPYSVYLQNWAAMDGWVAADLNIKNPFIIFIFFKTLKTGWNINNIAWMPHATYQIATDQPTTYGIAKTITPPLTLQPVTAQKWWICVWTAACTHTFICTFLSYCFAAKLRQLETVNRF